MSPNLQQLQWLHLAPQGRDIARWFHHKGHCNRRKLDKIKVLWEWFGSANKEMQFKAFWPMIYHCWNSLQACYVAKGKKTIRNNRKDSCFCINMMHKKSRKSPSTLSHQSCSSQITFFCVKYWSPRELIYPCNILNIFLICTQPNFQKWHNNQHTDVQSTVHGKWKNWIKKIQHLMFYLFFPLKSSTWSYLPNV